MLSAVGVSAFTCSVTSCCSVQRPPSVNFCDLLLFFGPYTIGITMLFCLVFTTLWLDFSCFDIQSFLIDTFVLCVFCDSLILLLYMFLFWIKKSGLVTPPGGGANPQFPTRPCTQTDGHTNITTYRINWPTAVSAARWIVELLQWKIVFKSPFLIWKLLKAEIWTEYSYDLAFCPIRFLVG